MLRDPKAVESEIKSSNFRAREVCCNEGSSKEEEYGADRVRLDVSVLSANKGLH